MRRLISALWKEFIPFILASVFLGIIYLVLSFIKMKWLKLCSIDGGEYIIIKALSLVYILSTGFFYFIDNLLYACVEDFEQMCSDYDIQ